MSLKWSSESFEDSDSSQINPREKSTPWSWDGREYVPSERSKKLATRALIGFSIIFTGIIAVVPILDKEQFRAESAPRAEVNFESPKLSPAQQKLVEIVLKENGLFMPDSLNTQP